MGAYGTKNRATIGGAALLLAIVAFPSSRSAATEERVFEDAQRNVRWTLPEPWTFERPSDTEAANGVAIRVAGPSAAMGYARVYRRAATSSEAVAQEWRSGYRPFWRALEREEVVPGRLAGLPCTTVTFEGDGPGGAGSWSRAWLLPFEGQVHEVVLVVRRDAREMLAAQIDAVQKGYRLRAGGPAALPAPRSDLFAGDLPPPAEPDLSAYGLRIVVPPGIPFGWGRIIARDRDHGLIALLAVKTGERDRAVIALRAEAMSTLWKPEQRLLVDRLQAAARDETGISIDPAMVSTDPRRKVGDRIGYGVFFAGFSEGRTRGWEYVDVARLQTAFDWIIRYDCSPGALTSLRAVVDGVLQGVQFRPEREPVPGPLAVALLKPSMLPRGTRLADEVSVSGGVVDLTKPAGLRLIDTSNVSSAGAWLFAFEGRSADGSAYLLVIGENVQWQRLPRSSTKADSGLEAFVRQRAEAWRSSAGEGAAAGAVRTPPATSRTLGGHEALAYRFQGAAWAVPYREDGWLIPYGSFSVWIRVQLGGAAAEESLGPLRDAVLESIHLPP